MFVDGIGCKEMQEYYQQKQDVEVYLEGNDVLDNIEFQKFEFVEDQLGEDFVGIQDQKCDGYVMFF